MSDEKDPKPKLLPPLLVQILGGLAIFLGGNMSSYVQPVLPPSQASQAPQAGFYAEEVWRQQIDAQLRQDRRDIERLTDAVASMKESARDIRSDVERIEALLRWKLRRTESNDGSARTGSGVSFTGSNTNDQGG